MRYFNFFAILLSDIWLYLSSVWNEANNMQKNKREYSLRENTLPLDDNLKLDMVKLYPVKDITIANKQWYN